MSLDKAIQHKKEYRRSYKARGKPGEWDGSCRPHGGCPWCENSRLRYKRIFREITKLEDV